MGNIAAFVIALIIVALILEMLRRKRLREKYAVLWLIVGLGTLILAGWPETLAVVSHLFGVQVPSNLLFAISILLLVGVCIHLSWELSIVEDETRILAEEVAILRVAIEKLQNQPPSGKSSASDSNSV